MDNSLKQSIISFLSDMKRKQKWAKARLKELQPYAGCYLETSLRNGTTYYYRNEIGDKTRHSRKYLGTIDNEEVLCIMEVQFLKQSLKRLDTNIRLTENLLRRYRSYDAASILNSLRKIYRSLPPGRCYRSPETPSVEAWRSDLLKLKEQHPPLYPEHLTILADDGTPVRSKSEQVIANMLFYLEIPYVYEAPLLLNGHWIHPDFTILLPESGAVYYIEHAGFMQDEEYARAFGLKLRIYIQAGILPDEQLILSFEGAGGQTWNSQILRGKLERLLTGDRNS